MSRAATRFFCWSLLAVASPLQADATGEEVPWGTPDPRLASFDRMLREFVEKHGVPAAALAVTAGGRLVYARGYGLADADAKETVTPRSLFRIASVSKPITAVAVLQLVERGRLGLEDRVFSILAEQYEDDGGLPGADARLGEVTIRHLLQHRGGWDRDASFDPMFRSVRFAEELGVPPPASPRDILRAMRRQPLDFPPGERYAYSNFGYCLLGRVIETVTGSDYETWVRENVLEPLGIRSMRLGRTRRGERAPGEVRYYDPSAGPSVFAEDEGELVPRPYGVWCLESMDAHGGWLASVTDLARFAAAFDQPDRCALLQPATVSEMWARPPGAAGHAEDGTPCAAYYGLGWMVRPVGAGGRRNTWHNGSLPGSSAVLIRRHDGKNFAVLMNTRVGQGTQRLDLAIDPLLHAAANEVAEWPQHDLFTHLDDDPGKYLP